MVDSTKKKIVVEFDGVVIGFCITFIASEKEGLRPHTWKEITGGDMPAVMIFIVFHGMGSNYSGYRELSDF